MPAVLILSSFVAASRVGGMAQALALAVLGIEPVVAPTVLFGRHPGLGAPGGAAVDAATFADMLDGVEAAGVFGRADAVVTGYFASTAQVRIAANAIDRVRAVSPKARIVVDPTLGDAPKGLYVPADTADAVATELWPRADLIALNAWELAHLSGCEVIDAPSACEAAKRLGKPVLVSSIACEGGVGVLYVDSVQALLAVHPREAEAPKGTGDLLTALFAAALVGGGDPAQALIRATGGVYEAVRLAAASGAGDLPIAAMGARLGQASPSVRLERLA